MQLGYMHMFIAIPVVLHEEQKSEINHKHTLKLKNGLDLK